MFSKKIDTRRGFTLLEILLVVAIIAILAGIVILAINPGKQLGDTRNAERSVDINTILSATYQYALDNDGNLPAGLDSVIESSQVVGTAASGCDTTCTATTTVAACVNLADDLTPEFLVGIPSDPKTGTDVNTDYYINKDANGRLVVGACDPEQGEAIEITR